MKFQAKIRLCDYALNETPPKKNKTILLDFEDWTRGLTIASPARFLRVAMGSIRLQWRI